MRGNRKRLAFWPLICALILTSACNSVTDCKFAYGQNSSSFAEWTMADFGEGYTSYVSNPSAQEVSGQLQLRGEWIRAGEWQDMGASVKFPHGENFEGENEKCETLTLKVKIPANATDFRIQIFLKVGPKQEWRTTLEDIGLKPGEWTEVTIQLSDLGGLRDVREMGFKVGSSKTAPGIYEIQVSEWIGR